MRCLSITLLATLLITTACKPQLTSIDIVQDTTPPTEHSVSAEGITLTHGAAIAITLAAIDEEGERHPKVDLGDAGPLDDGRPHINADDSKHVFETGKQFILRANRIGESEFLVTAPFTKGELVIPYEVIAP